MKKEFIVKICSNPYFLAVTAVILMYSIKITPLVFFFAGIIWTFAARKIIDFKTLLKFSLTFAIVQFVGNFVLVVLDTAGFGLVSLIIYPLQSFYRFGTFFILSFIFGCIIFFVTNFIFCKIFLFVSRFNSKK